MEWTIHGFNLIFFILHFHLLKHTITVEINMSRCLPEIKISNMRSEYYVISVFDMLLPPEVFNLVTNFGSLGMPEYKSTTCILLWMIILSLIA
jgi:hypothetical protein